MGRQAARGELRRRRPRQRLQAQGPAGCGPRHRARLPDDDGPARGCASSTSGTPGSTSRTSWISAPRADKAAIKAAEKNLAKARKRTSLGSLQKFAEEVDGTYRIRQVPPVIVPRRGRSRRSAEVAEARAATTRSPSRRTGASSSTTTTSWTSPGRWSASVGGDGGVHGPAHGRPRRRPAVPPGQGGEHVGPRAIRRGQRVRAPGRARRAGAARDAGGERRVPRLGHRAGGAPPRVLRAPAAGHEGLGGDRDECPGGLAQYGEICGATLARAHARPGRREDHRLHRRRRRRSTSRWRQFAVAYADQNEADYADFTKAADEERIAVERGV